MWQTSAYPAISAQSSPILDANEVLFISSAKSVLYAISSAMGSLVWFRNHQSTVYKTASPSIGRNGIVYIGSYDSTFYAYQSSTTTLKPIATPSPISNPFEISVSFDGYQVGAPWSHFRGNRQYSGQSSLLGPQPDSRNGRISSYLQLQWKYRTQAKIVSTTALAVDRTIYVGSTDGKLYALTSLGTVKWSYFINNKVLLTTPTIGYDGTIFVVPDDYYIYALSSEGSLRWKALTYKGVSSPIIGISRNNTNSNSNSTVSIYAAGEVYFYSLAYEGTFKWRYALTLNSNTAFFNSPVLGMNSSVLYVGTSDSYLYALSSSQGTFLWKYKKLTQQQT